jgi:hypothetical protein
MSPKPMVVATLKQYHTLSIGVFMFGSTIHTPMLTPANIIMYVVKNLSAPVRLSIIFISRVFFISSPPAFYNKIISILRITVNIFSKIKQSDFLPELLHRFSQNR